MAKIPALKEWAMFGGGTASPGDRNSYQYEIDGLTYSIDAIGDDRGRFLGWQLRVTPGERGLHAWLDEQGGEGYMPLRQEDLFSRASSAVVGARKHYKGKSNPGVPELERESGSWTVTSPKGQVVELFERKNAEKAAKAGWRVETSLQYLTRINREIKETGTVKPLKPKAKPTPSCGPGEVLIQRKGYTRSDGTYVAPSTFCQEDQGRPGVRSFGAKSASGKYADRADMPPLITREGKLGGSGYTDRPAKTRRAILKRCVEGGKMKLDGGTFDSPAYGYRSCLGSLTVLLTSTEMSAKKRKVIESDVKWLEKNYGGKKSNPEPAMDAKRARALKARLLK